MTEDEVASFHEAAHAVVARVCGTDVVNGIKLFSKYKQNKYGANGACLLSVINVVDNVSRMTIRNRTISIMSGMAAEKILEQPWESIQEHTKGDIDACLEITQHLKNPDKYLKTSAKLAHQIVKEYWEEIQIVADMLREERHITQEMFYATKK